MKNLLLTSSLALAFCAGGALAQEAGFQGGEVNLSFAAYSNENIDNSIFNFSGNFSTAYNISPAFGVQVGAGYNSFSLDEGDAAISIDMTDINAHAYYNFNENGKAGIFVARYSLSNLFFEEIGGPGIEVLESASDLMTYGVEGTMEFGGVSVELRYGMAEVQNSFLLDEIDSTLLDISFLTADVGYEISPKLEITARLANTHLSYDGDSADLFTYGVGAEYEVMTNLKVLAGLNGGQVSISGSSDTLDSFGYSLGVEYELAAGSASDQGITIYASFGSNNISMDGGPDEDVSNFKIGASIPFGSNSDDLYSRIKLF